MVRPAGMAFCLRHAVISADQDSAETATIGYTGLKLTELYVHRHVQLLVVALQNILNSGPRHLVSDFNAIYSWSGRQINQRGRNVAWSDEETTVPAGPFNGSTIDIVINKNVDTVRNVEVVYDLTSDHWPVTFETQELTVNESSERGPPNYSKTKCQSFRAEIRGVRNNEKHTKQRRIRRGHSGLCGRCHGSSGGAADHTEGLRGAADLPGTLK